MRLALVISKDFERIKNNAPPSLQESLLAEAWDAALEEQVLALAQFLHDGGQFDPVLICREGGEFAAAAKRLSLPFLSLRDGTCLLDRIKLWRWQKKIPQLLIMSIDSAGLKTAALIHRMRKKGSTPLVCSFPLRPPAPGKKEAAIISRASLLLCGSEYIAKSAVREMGNYPRLSCPDTAVALPGIDFEKYAKARPWHDTRGKNFVFGMAESLTPKSGALIVIRAMSALWQKEDLPPFEIRMFGAGARFNEVMEEAEKLGVLSRLSLLSTQNLAGAAAKCDAWLAPGSSPEEMPATLWAGFAAQIPVICSESELHQERLTDAASDAVVWVEENHPQKLARAMIEIMSAPDLRAALIENDIKEAELGGMSRMAREIARILRTLASPPAEERSGAASAPGGSRISLEKKAKPPV